MAASRSATATAAREVRNGLTMTPQPLGEARQPTLQGTSDPAPLKTLRQARHLLLCRGAGFHGL
jgi:hypothetical protein